MAEHRIAVKTDLGIKHKKRVAILAFAHRQRVDFDLFGIGADERAVETGKHSLRLLGQVAGQAKCLGNAAPMMGLKASGGIDQYGVDFLGAVMRHVFDVHAAFGRGNNRDTACCSVDEQSEVEFLLNVCAIGDV